MTLKKWYHHSDARLPSPTREGLDDITVDWVYLYRRSNPEGDPIPLLVHPPAILDDPPMEKEIVVSVWCLHIGRAGGPSGMRS